MRQIYHQNVTTLVNVTVNDLDSLKKKKKLIRNDHVNITYSFNVG